MKKIAKLTNSIQKYSWGTYDFIPQLLNIKNDKNEPYAELWMGAHVKASSKIGNKSLFELIKDNPEDVLGKVSLKQFPFLMKILSAEKALSIQAHPNKDQAEKGFELENTKKIPLTAFNRNYRDNNHKPELIVALTKFDAMCGFRPAIEIISNFQNAGIAMMFESFLPFVTNPTDLSLKNLIHEIMTLSATKLEQVLNFTLSNKRKLADDIVKEWLVNLYDNYGQDVGVLAPLYLNTFSLQPYQAVYLDAGILHAYLSGTGIEIMANSDNVLRGGLTPKYVDVPELMKTLQFKMSKQKIINEHQEINNFDYQVPVKDFKLKLISFSEKREIKLTKFPAIVLCTDGNIDIVCSDEKIELQKGESCLINGNVQEACLNSSVGQAFIGYY